MQQAVLTSTQPKAPAPDRLAAGERVAARLKGHVRGAIHTDPLMTCVWAEMLYGRHDPWFDAWDNTADLYLLFDIDLPWIADGTRIFGTTAERRKFFDLSRAILDRRGVRWALVRGEGEARYRSALDAIEAAG